MNTLTTRLTQHWFENHPTLILDIDGHRQLFMLTKHKFGDELSKLKQLTYSMGIGIANIFAKAKPLTRMFQPAIISLLVELIGERTIK